jgi:hypothetical protein
MSKVSATMPLLRLPWVTSTLGGAVGTGVGVGGRGVGVGAGVGVAGTGVAVGTMVGVGVDEAVALGVGVSVSIGPALGETFGDGPIETDGMAVAGTVAADGVSAQPPRTPTSRIAAG